MKIFNAYVDWAQVALSHVCVLSVRVLRLYLYRHNLIKYCNYSELSVCRYCNTPSETWGKRCHFIKVVMCCANLWTVTGCVRISAGLFSDLTCWITILPSCTNCLKWWNLMLICLVLGLNFSCLAISTAFLFWLSYITTEFNNAWHQCPRGLAHLLTTLGYDQWRFWKRFYPR